jgi:glucokinase
MRGNEFIINPITKPSHSDDLDQCLMTIIQGFEEAIDSLPQLPVAISFAFPGPADYENGIIGGYLPNFPSFRDGVALGPMLAARFCIPVFINNDGDLFALGEAVEGMLPEVNARIAALGSKKRYKNLLGYTFGTGFGIGSVINGELNRGNNSCVETFCLTHKNMNGIIAEEGVSIRAIKRIYGEVSGKTNHGLEPYDIYKIASDDKEGDKAAALETFRQFGEVAGNAMAIAATLTDSLIVIGGGLTGARQFFLPSLLTELRSSLKTLGGENVKKVQMKVFNLDNEDEFRQFARGATRPLKVYGTEETVNYDPMKCTGVAISKLGASRAISIGAYVFALNALDKKK